MKRKEVIIFLGVLIYLVVLLEGFFTGTLIASLFSAQDDEPQIITIQNEVVNEQQYSSLEQEEVIFEPRYGFTDDEIYLLTLMLCGDKDIHGDGEYDFDWSVQNGKDLDYYQICLVLDVVMNRVMAPGLYSDNVTDVVKQPGAFGFPRKGGTLCPLCIEVVREWCMAYDRWDIGVQVIPEDHYWFSAGPNLTNVSRAKF